MARAGGMIAEQPILCLPPATGDLPETGGLVVCSPATPFRKKIEHAGHCYQQKLIRSFALNVDAAGTNAEEEAQKQKQPPTFTRLDSSDVAKKLASKMAVGSDDLYELLELGEKRWHATADDIKKSFRRISLIYHPDKISHQGKQAKENSETHFKAVMKAYDILSDKKKRAAYDSIDDVDDSLPSEKDATASPQRFYEKFGDCFNLNARWSVSDRVPELGGDDTPIETVNKFYDYWYSFKSWRDFSFDLEYDVDQAECREEKRWMDRQNSKHVKTKKLEENARIRRLVDLAYKHDPRLLRVKQAAKDKKNAVKEQKKRKAEEAIRMAKEKEEKERQEAIEKAAEDKVRRSEAKRQKDAARQIMRKARQKLRAVAQELNIMHSDRGLGAVQGMCEKGSVESIDAITAALSGISLNATDSSSRAFEMLDKALIKPREPLSLEDCDQGTLQSVELGIKEVEKDSPVEVVSEEKLDKTPVDEAKQKSSMNGSLSPKKEESAVWTPEELSLLSKGVAKYPGGTRDRWNRLAEYIGTRSADEVLRKVNESRPSKIKPGLASAKHSVKEVNAFERFQEKKKGKPVVPQNQGKATAPKGKSSPAQPSNAATQPPNKLQFTPRQQSMFEAALKKNNGIEGEAKWKKVSAAVGRTPEQCKERFKELIAFYQSKKAS